MLVRPSRSVFDAAFAAGVDVCFFGAFRWESALPSETFDVFPVDLLRNVFEALLAGLSLRGLSEALDGAVSYNALNKYEKGEMMPSSSVLIELSRVLKRNQDFFFMPMDVRLEGIKFRKYSTKVSAADGKRIEAEAEDYFGGRL